MYFHRLLVAVALCVLVATLAVADVTTATHNSYALRPCSTCKEIKYDTEAECREAGQAEARRVGETRTTGSAVYTCITRHNVIATFRAPPVQPPPPPTCPAAPTSQTRTIQCPAGYTGSYTERSSSAVSAPPECVVTTTWTAVPPGNGACVPVAQPPINALFSDRFEYDIPKTGNADLFKSRGYVHVKAENSWTNRGGSGYIYTQFDQALGSRVLVIESLPTLRPPPGDFPYSQTDHYLQLGNETGSGTAIPANAWIQFFTYATPESRFSTRDKAIYPCRGAYPCQNLTWLFMWGSGGFEGVSAPAGGRYLALEGWGADRDTRVNDGDERKLFQNVRRTPLLAGRWYQVRLNIDISQAQGVYQAKMREPGQTEWTMLADWRGGVTPNFSWPIASRTGYNIVRIPTTVNQSNNTVYIDDFVIATSEAALPN